MIHLLLAPNFRDYNSAEKDDGNYVVLLPQKKVIVWEMWCSCRSWAIWDADWYFRDALNDFFGENNWTIDYIDYCPHNHIRQFNELIDRLNSENDKIDLDRYCIKRAKYKLPFYDKKPDKYQFVQW